MALHHLAKPPRARNAAIFVVVVLLWLALDQLSKVAFADVAVGEVVPGTSFGIIDFLLVHNTGAAWGMFGDSTLALAIFSLVICVLAVIYLFAVAPNSGILATVSLALIVSGGIGNAIDRIANGYVIDFIHTTFIDFPVFNVADIGVTCGVILFVISLFFGASNEDPTDNPKNNSAEAPEGSSEKEGQDG